MLPDEAMDLNPLPLPLPLPPVEGFKKVLYKLPQEGNDPPHTHPQHTRTFRWRVAT